MYYTTAKQRFIERGSTIVFPLVYQYSRTEPIYCTVTGNNFCSCSYIKNKQREEREEEKRINLAHKKLNYTGTMYL